MKRALLFFLFLLVFNFVNAQEPVPSRSVYLEIGGPGLPYSFNYDFRFDKERMDSWGMRVGMGGYKVSDNDSFFSIPLMVNKLYGKGPHYFELGFGATFFAFDTYDNTYCIDGFFNQNGEYVCRQYSSNSYYSFILDVDGSPSVMGTMNFGYRKVPVDGGFTWKVNINPIFNNNGFWPLFAGIGIGYSF